MNNPIKILFSKNKIAGFLSPRKFAFLIVGLIVIAGFLVSTKAIAQNQNRSENVSQIVSSQPISPPVPFTKQDINKDFSFTLTTATTKNPIKYDIESAELVKEIIINGQRAQAVNGRAFLLLNLKITNENNQNLQINTRNFVRLAKAENPDEWSAPDIHNDPVEVQAISTKYTRIGFPVNDTDKQFIIRVGEITGIKTDFPLNL